MTDPRYVIPFREITLESLAEVGGKNASLGELLRELSPRGIPVPDGFALSAAAFRLHLDEAGLSEAIYAELAGLDLSDVTALAAAGRSIRARVRAAPLPAVIARELSAAYCRPLPHLRRGSHRRGGPFERDGRGSPERVVRGPAGEPRCSAAVEAKGRC